MIKTLVEKVWNIIPYAIRIRIIRLTQKKFTVSVVAIVSNEKKEVLVLDHYLRPGASWGLPGGFIDSAEQPETAVKRELKEEADIDLINLRLVQTRTIRKHIEILFLAEANGTAKVNSPEIKEVGWFALDQLPQQMSPTQKHTVKKLLESN